MAPRSARLLAALVAAAAVGTFAVVGPAWVRPEPRFEEIVELLQRADFARANRLVADYLASRQGDPAAQLLHVFPLSPAEPGTPLPRAFALAPRHRVHGERGRLVLLDGRPDRATREHFARLEVESRELRGYGPTAPGASDVALDGADVLGPPNAAGRFVLMDATGELDRAPFVLLAPAERGAVSVRLEIARRLAGTRAVALTYLRAMVFANSRCWSEAALELRDLRRTHATDPSLRTAMALCLEQLGIDPRMSL